MQEKTYKNFKISNINTEIVDEILSHFIKSKNIIQKFKTLVKIYLLII